MMVFVEFFYWKFGWVMVDSMDIDFSEWVGKGLGYGVFRLL